MTARTEAFSAAVDAVMISECWNFARTVPRADHLSSATEPLDAVYYLRHRIETVRRIWETSRTDALALAAMVREDYEAARHWAEYVEEEMGHDKLYLADLARHDITKEIVASTPQFPSTTAMVDWMEQSVFSIGSLPAVAYSVFVEWNSERASPQAVERAKAAFSDKHVKGAVAHIAIDEKDDHAEVMLEVAEAVMRARGYGFDVLETLLRTVGVHFRTYFAELDNYARQHSQQYSGLEEPALPVVGSAEKAA